MTDSTKILDELGESVEQVHRRSKQTPEPDKFFQSVYRWTKKMEMLEPTWGATRGDFVDNRIRDEWLMAVAREEPHLGSVLSTAVTMDANRQYRLIGGRNQVNRFVKRFQDFDNGQGFRTLQEFNAYNYYATDLGAIVEIETQGKKGPLLNLYHTDPTRFRLGRKRILKYDGQTIWQPEQYYRLASQKTTQDKYNQLGYCAVSRCIKLAQTMLAIVTHNLEKLGHIAPKGILFIQAEDLTQESWEEAMEARKAVYITNTGNQYYDEVVTIVDRAAKGDLLALSQLPDGFDTFMFTDYMLKAYALAFNRDVRAFWSLNSGNFGGGTEATLQSEKATYGGAAEFVLASQEQIQWLLPDSLLFEYEVDDTRGKFQKAEVNQLLIMAAKDLVEIGLDSEKCLQWLAEQGVIPAEWTSEAENDVAENGVLKERYLELEHVRRAIDLFPDESLVMYESPSLHNPIGKTVRLFDKAKYANRKNYRGVTVEDYAPEQDTNRGNFMYTAAIIAYFESFTRDLTEEEQEAYDYAQELIDSGNLTDRSVDNLQSMIIPIVSDAMILSLVVLRRKSNSAGEDAELNNPDRWNSRLAYFTMLGTLYSADSEDRFTWHYGDTEHCGDCEELNGVTKTAAEWIEDGRVPKGTMLECRGYYCQCEVVPERE